MVWPAIIAAGAALAGSLLSNRAQNKAVESQEEQASANRDLQREFAQMGVRWRVADAKAAGINPLAALGMNATSYTPSEVSYPTDSPIGEGIRSMGQDISRAWASQASTEEKELARLKVQVEQEKLNGMRLDNMGKLTELNKLDQPSMPVGPAGTNASMADKFGLVGQGNVGGRAVMDMQAPEGYVFEPRKIPYSETLGTAAGTAPAYDRYVFPDGLTFRGPNQQMGDALDASWYHQMKFSAKSLVDHGDIAWYYYIADRSPEASKHRDYLRMDRPAAPPGYIYRMDPKWGEWRLEQQRFKGDDALYTGGQSAYFGDMPDE